MANFNWLEQWSQHKRQNGHSVFDLSKKMCFHLPNSMILPIRFIETVPDDHFIINMSGLMRTETMNKAAFYQGKAVFTAFFVPYKQLWHNFNQFVVTKEDKHSSTLRGSNYAPVVDLWDLSVFVLKSAFHYVKDEFGYSVAFGYARILQFAKYVNLIPLLNYEMSYFEEHPEDSFNTFLTIINPYLLELKGRKVNLWRLLAYQHIYYDFYRNKYYDDTPFFQPYGSEQGTLEYIDTFNMDDMDCSSVGTSEFVFLADEMDSDDGYKLIKDARLANILKPHYCQYRRDLYTSLLPSSQFGAVSGLQIDVDLAGATAINTEVNGNYLLSDYETPVDNGPASFSDAGLYSSNDAENVYHNHLISASELQNSLSFAPSSFDVLKLRRAELLQQWKQNALRAGNMVDDNFESHYGVKPYYEDDNNVRFLGQFECRLDVNPVTATADTASSENGKVGDLAAYGVGSVAGNEIDVQIKDFGVIVICAHFASEVYYSANGIDKQNTLAEPFDYFQSEFENAGLDSVSAWQQSLGIAVDNSLDMSFGFTPPYTFHKTEVDECFGEYSSEYIASDEEQFVYDWQGSLSSWTVKRSDLLLGGAGHYFTSVLPVSRFYQSPNVTDSIFGVQYDAFGKTDPFGFAVNIDVKAIRPMSVIGIPIFA